MQKRAGATSLKELLTERINEMTTCMVDMVTILKVEATVFLIFLKAVISF